MKRVLIALLALLLPALVQAQTIVGTAPLNDNSRKAASTEFVRALIAGLVPEAPSNGIYYFRRNSGWTAFAGPTTDAPNDGQTYCRSGLQWAACGSGGSASVTNASVLAAIGYTPVSRTGDTFTGGVTVPYSTFGANTVGATVRAFPNRPNNQVFVGGSGAQWSDCNTFENCPAKSVDTQFVQVLSRMRKQHGLTQDDYNISLDTVSFQGNKRPWQTNHVYSLVGEHALNGSNIYRVTGTGTSAGGGGPTGTGTGIADGSVTWSYEQANDPTMNAETVGLSNLCQFGQDAGHSWCEVRNTIMLPDLKSDFIVGKESDFGNYAYACDGVKATCFSQWYYGLSSFPMTSIIAMSTPPSTPTVGPGAPWQPNTAYTVPVAGAPIVSNAGHTYFLVSPGTSAGSGGPSGTDPQATITDGSAQWRLYDTGFYYGTPNLGGATFYGVSFQGANLIQHSNIYDTTHAYYGMLVDYGAAHAGASILDRSTSAVAHAFAGAYSNYGIQDTSTVATFAYIHGTHSFAGIFDDSSAVAFRSAGTHAGSAFSDTSTTPVSLALGGTYSNYGIQDTSTTPTFLYVHGAHSFAGVYDDSSAVAFRSAGTHSSAAMLDSSTSPVGLALSGTYSSAQITGNAFSVGPSGALAAASVNLAQGNKLNLKPGDASIYSPAGTNNFAFDMGSYRVLTMVGGNPNGMRIDSAGANFPPNLSVIGPDANMSMVQTVKGSGNFAFSNGSVASFINPGSTTLSTSSDERLKRDIRDTGRALPRLLDMRIRDYVWRSSGKPATGVIAQELRETHPEMVHKGQGDMLAVDAPNPWLLVKAIQELKADNDNLRRRVERLERRRR